MGWSRTIRLRQSHRPKANYRRRFGRALWRFSLANVSFASIRPNDVANPVPAELDRGIEVRRTELTCR